MMKAKEEPQEKKPKARDEPSEQNRRKNPPAPFETGGRKGPDPTRYGDWEKDGRCIDF